MSYQYWTKAVLYQNINQLTQLFCNNNFKHPLNSVDIAYSFCNNLTLEVIDFKTSQICGILNKGVKRTSIALNGKRDSSMQNFDCMHELIHYFFHKGSAFQCICSESNCINQDKFQEWQANEGAAQALVPYQLFIPEYVSLSKKYAKDTWRSLDINLNLAKMFNVSVGVIENRIRNLGYEIYQYLNGVPINELKILSNNQLSKLQLKDKYNPQKKYCTNCLSIINKKQSYCHICGTNLEFERFSDIFKTNTGVGYMKYKGIQIDQKFKAITCPRCYNEEIHQDGDFCKICGINLINKCLGFWDKDDNGNDFWVKGCGAILEGNARYCPFCGGVSTFHNNGVLQKWDYDPHQQEEIPF